VAFSDTWRIEMRAKLNSLGSQPVCLDDDSVRPDRRFLRLKECGIIKMLVGSRWKTVRDHRLDNRLSACFEMVCSKIVPRRHRGHREKDSINTRTVDVSKMRFEPWIYLQFSRRAIQDLHALFSVGRVSGLITLDIGSAEEKGPGLVRTVLELQCAKCNVRFERTFEERRRNVIYSDGELLQLDTKACPNHCGGDWFSIVKQHPIRKFKRRF
jgi:hypothetical protein